MRILLLIFFLGSQTLADWKKQSNDQLKLRTAIAVPRYTLEVQAPPENSNLKAVFEPHTPTKTSIGLAYRNIGISGSVTNATANEDDVKYGTSRSTDLNFRFFGKRTYEFFYQSYYGYFLKNSEDLDATYNSTDRKIIRSDMRSKNYGLNFYWNFNEEDFSQSLAFEQSGIAKSSGWGTSWLLHLSQSQLLADAAWIPSTASAQFGKLAGIKELKRQSLASGFAIGGIATAKGFYGSLFFAAGLGYQKALAVYEASPAEELNHMGTYFSLRSGLGYNGEKNVLGLQFLSDSVNTPIGKANISGVSIELSIFYAYRFDGVELPMANQVSSWLD